MRRIVLAALLTVTLAACGHHTDTSRLTTYAATIPAGPAGPVNVPDYVAFIQDLCDSPTSQMRTVLALSRPARVRTATLGALAIACPDQFHAATSPP
jgi:hypothetical protein